MTSNALLEAMYRAAVDAADPRVATRHALMSAPAGVRRWIIAIGKGSIPMARGALDALGDVAGGVVVTAAMDGAEELPGLDVRLGDHPVPGINSLDSAAAIESVTHRVAPGDDVLVLLSGGTTSLAAAPVAGITTEATRELFDALLRSGAPIEIMNAVRKRVLRWGGGRLAAALAGATVRCLVVSDVMGDDLASIGSGPCVPDATRGAELVDRLTAAGVWTQLPAAIREHLTGVAEGRGPETPKPGDAGFARVSHAIILNNRSALRGVAAAAAARGEAARIMDEALAGEAAEAGTAIATAAIAVRSSQSLGTTPMWLVWGGEPTVRIEGGRHGMGGRAQELALAAARTMAHHAPDAAGITLLAAGTDGRDGPTDAAGAIVDASTWSRIAAAGVDPERALREHDAYPALDAASALFRPGQTGTNVNDVVIVRVD